MLLRKVIVTITLALLVTSSATAIASPTSASYTTSNPVNGDDPKTQQLLLRLENIKKMDKSSMTRIEKRDLRKEVKSIKKEMKAISGGVYLSVGAIIIVILLLILLL
jgi:hypothetical protein